jgi:hypothetical protein
MTVMLPCMPGELSELQQTSASVPASIDPSLRVKETISKSNASRTSSRRIDRYYNLIVLYIQHKIGTRYLTKIYLKDHNATLSLSPQSFTRALPSSLPSARANGTETAFPICLNCYSPLRVNWLDTISNETHVSDYFSSFGIH